MNIFQRVKFWWDRQPSTHNEPGQAECKWAISVGPIHTKRIFSVLRRRAEGQTIEQIAAEEKVTRERIRQIVMKGCRQSRNHK